MTRRIVVSLFALILLCALCGCVGKPATISAGDIESITITSVESSETVSVDEDRFPSFAEAYNDAVLYRNDVGTTHPLCTIVTLNDGSTVSIGAGVGNFLTVQRGGEQFNIKGGQLGEWFEQNK